MPLVREYKPRQYDDEENVLCPLDGLQIKEHQRCSRCTILIGPKHHERQPIVIDHETICGDCARRAQATLKMSI